MPRDSSRNDRSPARDRSHGLSKSEAARQKYREIEEQLKEKDRLLTKRAKDLEANYGLRVDTGLKPSRSKNRNEGYMSPIRIGVQENIYASDGSSPLRVITPEPYRHVSPPRFNYGQQSQFLHDASPPQNRRDEMVYFDPPTDAHGFAQLPPPWYNEEVDVRVDEIPRWPMDDATPPPVMTLSSHAVPSYSQIWRNQEEIQVDPMPIFPVNGIVEEEKRETPSTSRKESRNSKDNKKHRDTSRRHERSSTASKGPNRDEKVRLQMEMIARQAEEAAKISEREVEEKRKARETIAEIRRNVVRDQETEKRKAERELRHAQKKKEEEEERRRAATKRRHEDTRETKSSASSVTSHPSSSKPRNTFYSDEVFLKELEPALGNIQFQAERIESKSRTYYKGTLDVVNIPKDLMIVYFERTSKGDAYKEAVSKYVSKLVELGIISDDVRQAMARNDNGAKYIADLVEPLCNDIAIYGTQISVIVSHDTKSKFVNFCKEKSLEFWSTPENASSARKYLTKESQSTRSSTQRRSSPRRKSPLQKSRDRSPRRHDVLRNLGNTSGHSRSHRDHQDSDKRKRTRSPSPSNKSSLEQLFASQPTVTSTPPIAPANGFMTQPPPLMGVSAYAQAFPMSSTYAPPPPMFYPNPAYQMPPGYSMPSSSLPSMMQQSTGLPAQLHYQHHAQPTAPPGVCTPQPKSMPAPRQEDDIDLMDDVLR